MKKSHLTILALCAALGLALGASHRHLLGLFQGGDAAAPESLPNVQLPEEGVESDAFSLKLLQAALTTQGKGNVCVAPLATASLLQELAVAAGGSTRELLENKLGQLKLSDVNTWRPMAASPLLFSALFADDSLAPAAVDKGGVRPLRVPMSRNPSQALALINGMESEQMGNDYGHFFSGDDVTADKRLIALLSQSLSARWLLPMHAAPAHESDFFRADGGVAATLTLMSTDTHTLAAAPDGSWQALALFLKREGRRGEPCALVAIMPRGNARSFAQELTPEKLSDIRRALAQAAPQQATICLPALSPSPTTRHLLPLLLELGLGKLFTKGADFSGISASPLHLDLAAARYNLTLTGQDAAPTEASGTTIRFNQAFIWFIGDLTSATPPLYFGLEEER